MATVYAVTGFANDVLPYTGVSRGQNSFGDPAEFVYTIQAPPYIKQLANKEVEKTYEFTNVNQALSGVRFKATYVKIDVQTEPLESGTKIIFDATAENVEFNGAGYNLKRDSANISGYGILNKESTKLTVHIPWAEIMKNL